MAVEPYPGLSVKTAPNGTLICRLHYSADPEKGKGKKVFVPEINKELSPWALQQFQNMSESMYRQELEIDFAAKLGAHVFEWDRAATLCPSFPIPADWPRYYALDPHKRKVHAHLWAAVDPYGDVIVYRELWPSVVRGKPGNIPENDNRWSVHEYIKTLKWLESADNDLLCSNGEPEGLYVKQAGQQFERVVKRSIDYAARGIRVKGIDDPDDENLEEYYREEARKQGWHLLFQNAKKDRAKGIMLVNDWLRPVEMDVSGKGWVKRSRLRIFEDKCLELVRELDNVRYPQLTAKQAETRDPMEDPEEKRDNTSDCLRYILMENPAPMKRDRVMSSRKPLHSGVAY